GRGGSPEPPAPHAIYPDRRRLRSIAPNSAQAEQEEEEIPKCPQCGALVRPGVVWFGEQLPLGEIQRVENFLDEGACDFALVIGTTATFGYIIDWARQASRDAGELIEVNPEETSLSRFATHLIREPAAVALPRLVNELVTQ